MPSKLQKDLMLAQSYVERLNERRQKGEQNEEANITDMEVEEKQAYDKVYGVVSKTIPTLDIINGFVAEKSYKAEEVNGK